MPKLTIANQDYESFSEKITTPSIILTEISSDGESYYIPLFKGNYSDGSVVQLGDYNYTLGKLKVGDLRAALSREEITGDVYASIAKVFANNYTTWVLTVDGKLYGCGKNASGNQGSGDTKIVKTFTKRAENVKEFKCTDSVTWYIDNNNDLYGCGYNEYGQQGSGDTENVLTFTKRAENVKEVICIDSVTWYIDFDNNLYGCGYNYNGQQGNGDRENVLTFTKRAENVKKFSCSSETTWYIDLDNNLYGCGYNGCGQQGFGSSEYRVLTFIKRAENVKEVICLSNETWYLTNDGELYDCGWNSWGEHGTGEKPNSYTWYILAFTKRAENVKEFKCADSVAWYLTNDNELYGCGHNRRGNQGNGESGDENSVYTFTKRAENVKEFSCDNYVTWYLTNDNNLYGCGYNEYGQQSNGESGHKKIVTAFTKRAENVKEFWCSMDTTWYIDLDNNLYGCGNGIYGNQGNGRSSSSSSIVTTFTKRAENVKDVRCTYSVTWYLTNGNNLYGCGMNDYGNQGSGGTYSVSTFTKKELK